MKYTTERRDGERSVIISGDSVWYTAYAFVLYNACIVCWDTADELSGQM